MKSFNITSLLLIVLLIYTFNYSICVKINNKLNAKKDQLPVDPERIPGVHIHVEYNDLDPINTKKYDNERKSTLDRIREMELKLKAEKINLEKVIVSQASKISEVSQLALATFQILKSVS